MDARLIGGLGFVLVAVLLLVFWAFAAGLVQIACYLLRMPVPGLYRAMGAVFIAGLVNGLLHALVQGIVLGERKENALTALVIDSILLPIDFLVGAVVYSAILPKVTFGKGVLIYLIQLVMGVAIGGLIVLIVVAAKSAGIRFEP